MPLLNDLVCKETAAHFELLNNRSNKHYFLAVHIILILFKNVFPNSSRNDVWANGDLNFQWAISFAQFSTEKRYQMTKISLQLAIFTRSSSRVKCFCKLAIIIVKHYLIHDLTPLASHSHNLNQFGALSTKFDISI